MGFHGDTKDGKFWRSMANQLGALVKIKDMQAVEDAMDEGRGLYLEDRQVKQIRHFRLPDLNADWIFFYLPGKQDLWLMVRVVGNDADTYTLFQPFEMEGDEHVPLFDDWNREDFLDEGVLHFFCEPDDPDDFIPAELEWTQEFTQEVVDVAGNDVETLFSKEEMGTLYPELHIKPMDPAMDGLLCGITEYDSADNIDNPHIIIVETGIDWDGETEEGKAEGGLVEIYQGCYVEPSDIDFDCVTL